MTWTGDECRELAREFLGDLGPRWAHVQAVAKAVAPWRLAPETMELITDAAWLHDIGYAPAIRDTGMHAIDGARFLDRDGAPKILVSLVAFHTGAEQEADERGLMHELMDFDRPDQDDLDLLILADLVSGPNGQRLNPTERLDEIFHRYEPQHPVHRAVSKSRPYLEACAQRAAARVGYPMYGAVRPSMA